MFRVCSNRLSKSVIDKLVQHPPSLEATSTSSYDPIIPVDMFQQALYSLHDLLGLSWPAACVALAAAFRTVTLPIYVWTDVAYII